MHNVFNELSLIIAIGAGVSLLMRLLRQPLIIGHILTGVVVGPSVLKLIQSGDTIEVFSNIGIALLLFIIGLGLNPKVIKEVGKVAALAGLLQMAVTAAFAWAAATILGLTHTEAVLLAAGLSFSSTIIILKMLSDKKEQSRLYGKITIGILLIQDIMATIALLVFTAQVGETGEFSINQLLTLLGKGLLIALPIFLVGYKVLPRLRKLIAGSQEFLFLFAIGWGFGCAALFELSGFSLEVGALIAGVALAGLPYTQEISSRLRPLRDFFVVVFFINLGAHLSFNHVWLLIPSIVASIFIVVIIKPLIVMFSMGLLGYTERTSFKTSVTMAQISEFSLVLSSLALVKGRVSEDFVSTITVVALVTIAISTYLMTYSDRLFDILGPHLKLFERAKAQYEQKEARHNYELVLFGYQRGGNEFVKVFRSLKKRFVVVDYDPEVIDTLERADVNYLYGDVTDAELLDEVGLEHSRLIVSTITDHAANALLLNFINKANPSAVVILHADTVEEASELYELGASYVMMPHYIGSEKIGAFIRRSGFKKSEFRKFRDRHLAYLQSHYDMNKEEPETASAQP
jgi:Kef-type K+ transport system membrane component KefB